MTHHSSKEIQTSTTVYDCGGRGGMNEQWLDYPIKLNYVSFDPEADAFRELHGLQERYAAGNANIHFDVENCALANKAGEQTLFVYSSPDLSSFLEIDPEATHRYRNNDIHLVKQAKVKCDTLDNISGRRNHKPDFLSIDTQGTEIDVLSGAEGILKDSVIGLRCEVEFVPLYRRQPLFDQVWQFLDKRGFRLVRFDKTGSGLPGISTDAGPFSLSIDDAVLAWADAVFFRKNDALNFDSMEPPDIARMVLKYVLLSLVNNCGSIGLDLLWRLGREKKLESVLESLSLYEQKKLVDSALAYLEDVEGSNWQTDPHYLEWYGKERKELRRFLEY